MNLKLVTLSFAAFSSTAFAGSYDLSTVVNQENQNKIISEMIDTFKKGVVDKNTPVTLSGNFEVNDQNRLTAINVDKVGFKVINVPLIGTYQTEASIKALINDDSCKNITITQTSVIKGSPSFVNPIFATDLKNNAAKAIEIFIKNSDLSKYCAKETYTVIFN
ncbi:hypothetical protein QEJ31_13765 [Pigmentibacter sp. JX0631]|uniref:hypothetical protein n=1 Tax=Pigmentibacter sp. JX0631 TaxID=2976982 RepID=UPI002468FA7D|nr:hypothetical protein [Pigmentibacter sp. JX0631]WGL59593.1 hypothetical protein QEJ31_13765 [Pigmentibacter sp. JX0631]